MEIHITLTKEGSEAKHKRSY